MNIGILGLGSIGSRHERNLRALGHQIMGFDIVKTNGGIGRDEIIAKADAMVIATPTSEHFSDILSSHNKPTFVEKPIAMTRNQHTLIKEYVFLSNIMLGNNLRWHAAVRKVKEWMDMGLIGEPLWAQLTAGYVRESGKYGEDGVTLSSGAHSVDLAYHLLGPAKVVAASIDPQDIISDSVLLHDNGCRTHVHVDWVTDPQVHNGTICGTKSRVHFELAPGRAYYRITRGSGISNIYTCNDTFDLNYAEEMAAFVDFAQGRPLVGASGADGLAVLGLLLDIKEMAGLAT